MTTTSTRAQRIADAAITLLAERGLRGLTHRAVDEAAGLPEGSTSNHARTRAALLGAALDRLAELESAGFDQISQDAAGPAGPGPEPESPPAPMPANALNPAPTQTPSPEDDPVAARKQFAADIAGGLHTALTEGRALTIARFELALEAGRRPELRERYDNLGSGFVRIVAALLADAGCADPARAGRYLVSWCEGILFHATAGAGQADPPSAEDLTAQVDLLLTGLLGL